MGVVDFAVGITGCMIFNLIYIFCIEELLYITGMNWKLKIFF